MLAVHFGAGNIGRGFIGGLLSEAGYQVCFVDVNSEIVDLLNEKKSYRVVLVSDQSEEKLVNNVRAINSIKDPDDVIEAIVNADLITTAVGPTILPIISGLMADGLKKRVEKTNKRLNIIACENMIDGSEFLKKNVYEKITEEEKNQFDLNFAFPNAAVDRIVPNQINEDKLIVHVEPFYEWVIDQSMMLGEVPKIEGVTYVNDLRPYIERKLFTVNTGHAVAAYIGYQTGLETIKDAMEHPKVLTAVEGTLKETGDVLIRKYDFDYDNHVKYITKIIGRFTNPYINDEIPRVARGPLRKLGHDDRLVSPAIQYYDYVKAEPVHLANAIVAALKYDFRQDDEALELQKKIKELSYEKTLNEVCGLKEDHPLFELILSKLH
ncbi:mannitol-1-phosphate 5-dehydrogenase [Bacillus sp. EAC]|uniref:mannitol-1-phosphate 5-dehydrogenase n=1 Tax=Bacillus sp. EAC TaxID=1978338 RepID=UPI000B434A30|nr:mannitol-1-phosphate 5-dehydrogenase [Bacillus sp. EAC]